MAITVVALGVAIGGGAWMFLNRDSAERARPQQAAASATTPAGQQSTPTPSTSPSTEPPSSASSTTSSASPTSPTNEAQAVSMLNHLAATGEKQVPIDNKYLISLSLKWVGIKDTTQQPQPFTAVDIWNHFDQIIKDPRFRGDVKVVRDGHFGNQLSAENGGRGRAWVALIDPNLPTEKAGVAWCEANFAERGQDLVNVCYPRKASPPHD